MFLYNSIKSASNKIKHYFKPDENPTKLDFYAFKLLDNLNVKQFIEFFNANNLSPNVIMPTGVSLLMKAVEMANKTKDKMTHEDIITSCIAAINFLVSKGANINHQDNSGRTALLTACHWRHSVLAEQLIKLGANIDLATTQSGWKTNPLIAACFKEDYELIILLVINGANIDYAIELNGQQNGFRLQEKEVNFMKKARNMRKLIQIRMVEDAATKVPTERKWLSRLNDIHFQKLLEVC